MNPGSTGRRLKASTRLWLGGSVLGLAAALFYWSALLFDDNLHSVVPGEIYRSGHPSPEVLARWASELGLRSVVSARGESAADWYRSESTAAESLGLSLQAVRLSAESMPSPEQLQRLIGLIDAAPRPVLLHCAWGVERTGLASAVALLLAGEGPETASEQFGARFGFWSGFSRREMPAVIDDYADWLADNEITHTPEGFRDWARVDYIPHFYRATIEVVGLPDVLTPGDPYPIELRVTNRSQRTFAFAPDRHSGVHLWLRVKGVDNRFRRRLRTGYRSVELAPGASTRFEVWLWKFPKPGRYRLSVGLVNEEVAFFEAMGSPPFERELRVDADAAPGAGVPPI